MSRRRTHGFYGIGINERRRRSCQVILGCGWVFFFRRGGEPGFFFGLPHSELIKKQQAGVCFGGEGVHSLFQLFEIFLFARCILLPCTKLVGSSPVGPSASYTQS